MSATNHAYVEQDGGCQSARHVSGPECRTDRQLHVAGVDPWHWLATFSISYANILTNPFKGNHGPTAGDFVIVKATDLTHAFILGAGGSRDTIF